MKSRESAQEKDGEESGDEESMKRTISEGSKVALSIRKRESERRRREEIHSSFKDLERLLSKVRGEELIRGRKWDREKIVSGAIECIREQETKIQTSQTDLEHLLKEVEELRSEKTELRQDKLYLKEELGKLRDENKHLRTDNIALWQQNRKQVVPAEGNQVEPTVFLPPEPTSFYQPAPPDSISDSQTAAQIAMSRNIAAQTNTHGAGEVDLTHGLTPLSAPPALSGAQPVNPPYDINVHNPSRNIPATNAAEEDMQQDDYMWTADAFNP